jgi:hypothetical protein
VLLLEPSDVAALASLEKIHRTEADQHALVEVLRRRVDTATDANVRREGRMEMARLLVAVDDAAAEQSLRAVLAEIDAALGGRDGEALRLLDELYERTDNSAGLVEVLTARIALEALAESRVVLRARLAVLKLRRSNDPMGALEDLRSAVNERIARLRRWGPRPRRPTRASPARRWQRRILQCGDARRVTLWLRKRAEAVVRATAGESLRAVEVRAAKPAPDTRQAQSTATRRARLAAEDAVVE